MVELQGVVTHDNPFDGVPAAGVSVTVLDGLGEEVDKTSTLESGLFRASAPAGEAVHLLITSADGFDSSFRGIAGMNPRTPVPAGFAHTFDENARAEWMARFNGCPEMGPGGMVVGNILVDLFDDQTGERPVPHAASIDIFDLEGNLLSSGCYLDDDGEAFMEGRTKVGDTGIFAAFGLPAGGLILRIEANLVIGQSQLFEFDLLMPENGTTPRFPILVPFEL